MQSEMMNDIYGAICKREKFSLCVGAKVMNHPQKEKILHEVSHEEKFVCEIKL